MSNDHIPSQSSGRIQLFELRCAVAIIHCDAVLLVQRIDYGDWVLPGGTPHPHESLASCAQREAREETGLDVHLGRCGLVLEVNDPVAERRIVELVFVADEFDPSASLATEPRRWVAWVPFDELRRVPLRPAIADYLPDLAHPHGTDARYLGDMWQPAPVDR